MIWTVYLSGEIHTDWRGAIVGACEQMALPIEFTSAVVDHAVSDAAGDHLGTEQHSFWRDHKSAKVNSIRIQNLIQQCDIAVVRFGDKYKQWNAAFDAGYLAATGTPYITLHDESLVHALKEVDAAAMAWAQTTEQVAEILKHVTTA